MLKNLLRFAFLICVSLVPAQAVGQADTTDVEVKAGAVATGTVKWFDPTKGYGFIQPSDGSDDVFVHISAVERAGLETLHEGQKVQYELIPGRNGDVAEQLVALEADQCPFEEWMIYKDVQLYRNDQTGAYLYTTGNASVDADGAPNAYHPDDVGQSCGPTGSGLDCPANAGYPNTDWWPSVLAKDPDNPDQAYVQDAGPYQGFFVSKTALVDRSRSRENDIERYVDARNVPYLVFPGPFYKMRGTGKLGDLGIAYHLDTKKSTPFVVADIGPNEPLGEASIALFEALGGENVNPRTGRGVARGDVLYVVFPYSVDDRSAAWPLDNPQMEQAAKHLLDRLGGMSALMGCVP